MAVIPFIGARMMFLFCSFTTSVWTDQEQELAYRLEVGRSRHSRRGVDWYRRCYITRARGTDAPWADRESDATSHRQLF